MAATRPRAAFVRRFWEPLVDEMEGPPRDPKTALQEWAQARGLALPDYKLVATSGPDHALQFTVAASVAGHDPATATASSKRTAEAMAAATLLDRLADKAQKRSDFSFLAGAGRAEAQPDVIGNPGAGFVHQDRPQQFDDLGACLQPVAAGTAQRKIFGKGVEPGLDTSRQSTVGRGMIAISSTTNPAASSFAGRRRRRESTTGSGGARRARGGRAPRSARR